VSFKALETLDSFLVDLIRNPEKMEVAPGFGCFQYQQQSSDLYVNSPMCFPQNPSPAVGQNMGMAPAFGCCEYQHQPALYVNPPMCFPENPIPYGGHQQVILSHSAIGLKRLRTKHPRE